MAIFRKELTAQAVKWTGDNIEEVKSFLGDCFISANRTFVTYLIRPESRFPKFAELNVYIQKSFDEDVFWLVDSEEFERQWVNND